MVPFSGLSIVSFMVFCMSLLSMSEIGYSVVYAEESLTENAVKNTTKSINSVTHNLSDSKCEYKIQKNDKVYVQVTDYRLSRTNMTLKPYFYLYHHVNGKAEIYCKTGSRDGKQFNHQVDSPKKYTLRFPRSEKMDFSLDVLSDWGNQVAVKGKNFSAESLFEWTNSKQNKDVFTLEISEGNKINLKFIEKDEEEYIFQVVSYSFEQIEKSYLDFVKDKYPLQLILKDGENELLTHEFPDGQLSATINNSDILEILLENESTPEILFQFVNDSGEVASVQCSVEKIFADFNAKMQQNPEDKTTWTTTISDKKTGNTITLKFAGIQKIYAIKSINIPTGFSKRDLPRYAEKGYAPKIRVYVYMNGKSCGIDKDYAATGIRAWSATFPEGEKNRFEIREGIDSAFSISIRDADTMFYEIFLLDISNICDLAFRDTIFENETTFSNRESAVKIDFQALQ
ncbi:MAG: hypothetical protein Q4C70_09440 [Planctomycetia bacterium]|nr:hypothetical protein [Planctomycetia bacterium]